MFNNERDNMLRSTRNKIEGLKKAIEIVKSTIDVEAFCNHIGVTKGYFTHETITKTVTAIQKEIERLECI